MPTQSAIQRRLKQLNKNKEQTPVGVGPYEQATPDAPNDLIKRAKKNGFVGWAPSTNPYNQGS